MRSAHTLSTPEVLRLGLYSPFSLQSQQVPECGAVGFGAVAPALSTRTVTPFLLWVSVDELGHARLQEYPWASQRAEN